MSDSNFERHLKSELARQLGPVNAPPDLWNRIQRERTARPARGWVLWPAVAAVLVASCADLGWQMSRARTVAAAPRFAGLKLPEARRAECMQCHT